MRTTAGPSLIIGYGNELRGDDGAGFELARRLPDDPRFTGTNVLARRQLTPELAIDISRARLIVLVDASTLVGPGEVSVRKLDPAPAGMASSHQMSPEALLGFAAELYGAAPPAYVVSIGAESLEMEQDLSPEVEAALARAANEVARIVEGHGRA